MEFATKSVTFPATGDQKDEAITAIRIIIKELAKRERKAVLECCIILNDADDIVIK